MQFLALSSPSPNPPPPSSSPPASRPSPPADAGCTDPQPTSTRRAPASVGARSFWVWSRRTAPGLLPGAVARSGARGPAAPQPLGTAGAPGTTRTCDTRFRNPPGRRGVTRGCVCCLASGGVARHTAASVTAHGTRRHRIRVPAEYPRDHPLNPSRPPITTSRRTSWPMGRESTLHPAHSPFACVAASSGAVGGPTRYPPSTSAS